MKLFYCILFSIILSGCANQNKLNKSTDTNNAVIKTPSGLQYVILKKGNGIAAKAGHEVLIYETASYLNGTVLFSNEGTGKPVKVLIGGHQATDGEDEGLRGMQESEIRKLILPPYLAKRTAYPPNVSPDSTIVVHVELYKILNK